MIISLPIEDRPRSYAFYQEAFGFKPVGELAEDGIPEPLQFALTDDVSASFSITRRAAPPS